jgi:hypothetical protein
MPPERAHISQLTDMAEFSEAAKSVVFSAFNLHLLGLNARVLATKLGDQGRAFAVLSAEWVVLGRQFEASMKSVETLTEHIVRGISRAMIRRYRAELLSHCEADFKGHGGSFKQHHDQREQNDFFVIRQQLRTVVDEALRGCLFGRVIARSAKIEAGWNPESQQILSTLATDFEGQLASILPSLRTLDLIERRGLS